MAPAVDFCVQDSAGGEAGEDEKGADGAVVGLKRGVKGAGCVLRNTMMMISEGVIHKPIEKDNKEVMDDVWYRLDTSRGDRALTKIIRL